MFFNVRAVTADQYAAWLARQQALAGSPGVGTQLPTV